MTAVVMPLMVIVPEPEAMVMAAPVELAAFAVAVTPVRAAFFTTGPGLACIWLCALTPSVVLRLSGDDSNRVLLRFGGGFALNLVRPLQFNGGLLFGTDDVGTAWRWSRSWYVGIAVDPVLLVEAIGGSPKKE